MNNVNAVLTVFTDKAKYVIQNDQAWHFLILNPDATIGMVSERFSKVFAEEPKRYGLELRYNTDGKSVPLCDKLTLKDHIGELILKQDKLPRWKEMILITPLGDVK